MRTRMQRLRRNHDAGAISMEAVGIVVVAALIVSGVTGAVATTDVGQRFGCSVVQILGQAACPGGAASDKSRDDTARDARDNSRDNARDTARGDQNAPNPPAKDVPGTPGGTATSDGLGPGVPGTNPPPMPSPPAWKAPDAGAGPHGSKEHGWSDLMKKKSIEVAANTASIAWPDAGRNLLHFLGNTGETLTQDVDSMLSANPKFSAEVNGQRDQIITWAAQKAKVAGATGPMTFPVNTPWYGFYFSDDKNWYYALGGVSYNQTGHVTITPPASPGDAWTFTLSTQVNIRDQYNWDGGKSTEILGMDVTDEELSELHRKGLAKEFTAVGTSSTQTSSGSVP